MPSARFYNESSFGFTLYSGEPDQKITMTSNPFDWLEASFFYTSIKDRPYCAFDYDPVCDQDYKDKGFNFKLKIKEEGKLPAIAIGINDIAGTGYYSSGVYCWELWNKQNRFSLLDWVGDNLMDQIKILRIHLEISMMVL